MTVEDIFATLSNIDLDAKVFISIGGVLEMPVKIVYDKDNKVVLISDQDLSLPVVLLGHKIE